MTSLKDDMKLADDIEKLHRLEEAVRHFSKSCDICIGRNCPFHRDCEKKDFWEKVLSKRLDNNA